MPTPIDLIKHFGPSVRYPFGGEHHLLLWYEHSRGHEVIIAKTLEQMVATWDIVFKKYGAEPTDYRVATLVSPPESFIKTFAENNYRLEVRELTSYLCCMATQYKQERGSLPPNTTICTHYKFKPSYDDQKKETSKTDKNHYCCANCNETFQFGAPVEELFLRNFDNWLKAKQKRSDSRQSVEKPVTTVTHAADPSQPIYVANGDFGHHSNGVTFMLLKEAISASALFYFQGEKRAIPKQIKDSVAAHILADKKAKEIASEEFLERRRKENATKYDELLRILGHSNHS